MVKSRNRRPAFTLLELLVVIAIIAILVGLTVRGTFHVIETQRASNTETSLRTVHQVLQKHWSEVVATAKKESPIPPAILSLAGGDQERARVILIKFRLVEAFPQSYAEINNPSVYAGGYIPTDKRKYINSYYKKLNGRTAANDPATESAACLYLALSTVRGGVSVSPDSLGNNSQDSDADTLFEIVDSWSRPLRFYRFPTNNLELAKSNPARPGTAAGDKFKDPIDPDGRLASSNWNVLLRQQFEQVCGYTVLNPSDSLPYYTVPVLASPGRNGILGLDYDMSVIDQNGANDNIYSFNLRLGAQGN